MTNEHTTDPEEEGISDRSEFDIRRQGDNNLPPHAGADPVDASEGFPSGWPEFDSGLPEQLQILVAQIIRQEVQTFPDPDTAAELRSKAPEVYEAWLETTRETIETDNYVRRAAVDNPREIASRGQLLGFISVLALFVLAGWAAYLDLPWLAAFLGGINVVGLATAFLRNRSSENKQEKE